MAVFTFTTEDVFYSSDYFLCKWGNDLIKLRGFKQSGKPIEEKLCRWLVSKFSFRSLVDHVFCYWKDCYFKKYYRLCFGFKTTIIHVEYWVTCASRRFYFCNTTLLFMYFFKKRREKSTMAGNKFWIEQKVFVYFLTDVKCHMRANSGDGVRYCNTTFSTETGSVHFISSACDWCEYLNKIFSFFTDGLCCACVARQ